MEGILCVSKLYHYTYLGGSALMFTQNNERLQGH